MPDEAHRNQRHNSLESGPMLFAAVTPRQKLISIFEAVELHNGH